MPTTPTGNIPHDRKSETHDATWHRNIAMQLQEHIDYLEYQAPPPTTKEQAAHRAHSIYIATQHIIEHLSIAEALKRAGT